jgi:hypothetical protein
VALMQAAEPLARKNERRATSVLPDATAHGSDVQFTPEAQGRMTQTEILTEAIIATVRQGKRTVCQLRQQLDDGLAYIEDQGVDNVEKELLMLVIALDSAIQRIELNGAEGDRRRDN